MLPPSLPMVDFGFGGKLFGVVWREGVEDGNKLIPWAEGDYDRIGKVPMTQSLNYSSVARRDEKERGPVLTCQPYPPMNILI
jgi:hypothetical protein